MWAPRLHPSQTTLPDRRFLYVLLQLLFDTRSLLVLIPQHKEAHRAHSDCPIRVLRGDRGMMRPRTIAGGKTPANVQVVPALCCACCHHLAIAGAQSLASPMLTAELAT